MPLATSSQVENSCGAWLIPSRLGTKIMPIGTSLEISPASCTAPLGISAVVKPADCGGPLVDLDGNVIGINISRAGRTESWAIPTEVIMELLGDLKSGKLAPNANAAPTIVAEPIAAPRAGAPEPRRRPAPD